MVESSFSIPPDTARSARTATPNEKPPPKNFPTNFLGKAARMAIFAPKDFSHDSGPNLLPHALIRRQSAD